MRWRHRARTAVVAVAVAGLAATLIGWPGRSGVAEAQSPAFRLQLVDQQFSFGPDQAIRFVFELAGDLSSLQLAPPAATTTPTPAEGPLDPGAPVDPLAPAPVELPPLTMQVTNYPPLTDVADVDEFVGGSVDRAAFGDTAIDGIVIPDVRPLVTVGDDGSVLLALDLPTDVINSVEDRLKFEVPGLYPIRSELYVGEPSADTLLATHGTIAQRLPGPADTVPLAPTINLAVVTAQQADSASSGSAVTAGAEAAFDESVTLATNLTAPVTLQVPPPVVASAAAATGSATLEQALDGADFVAQPALPVDVSSLAAVGRDEVFARQLAAGEQILTEAVPTTPTQRGVWLATEPLSSAGAQELRDLGFRYIVMPQALYRDTVAPTLPATDLFVDVALPDGDTLPLLVVDDLADELTTSAANRILARSTATEWAVSTLSEMLVAPVDEELERSRVLSTPDLAPPDSRLLIGLERLLATTPSARFSSATTLTGTTDTQTADRVPVVVELPDVAGADLAARVELLDNVAIDAASTSSMLPADDPRPGRWAAEIERLISSAYTDDEVVAALGAIQSATASIRSGVALPDPFTFTMTGKSGDIELRVNNTTDERLDVLVRLDSPKFTFPGADDLTSPFNDHRVTLRPNSETSLLVPVRARSNGTSPISVELLTPAGQSLGPPIALTSRVTAFTGLGQVLTAGFLLVLATWWFANWRGRRRERLNDGRGRHPSRAASTG